MRYLKLMDVFHYHQHSIIASILILLFAFSVGYIIHRVYEYSCKDKEKPNKPERFRLEITEMSKDYVRTGLNVPKETDGLSISSTLKTGLTLIGKKDPLVLRILLLQTLEILSGEEDIEEALSHFQKDLL